MGNPDIKSSKISVGDKKVPFVKWYNDVFLKDKEIAKDARRTNPIAAGNHFAEIFDNTKMWYAPVITGNEFIAFFSIFCNETGGKLRAIPEGGEKGDAGKYFFEPRKGVKVSYNDGKMNRLAGDQLVAMKVLKEDDDQAIKAWNGQVWPKEADDEVKKASLQCDYYKYRGRGIIQTTWRSTYLKTVEPLVKKATGKSCDALTEEELTKAVCDDMDVYLGMVKNFFSGPKWKGYLTALAGDTPGWFDVGHHVSGGKAYAEKFQWRCEHLSAALTKEGYEAK